MVTNRHTALGWLIALGAGFSLVTAPTAARAQAAIPGFDPSGYLDGTDYDCRDFRSQAEAQAVLRADPTDPHALDNDGNGIACELNAAPRDRIAVPSDFDPRAWVVPGQDRYNCADFISQAEAQAVLRADPRDPNRLDGNRAGVACEGNDGPYSRYPARR